MTNRARTTGDIRRAIDACLPDLPAQFNWKVIRAARKGSGIRRKVSGALALAVILALLTGCALAAVLLWPEKVEPLKEVEKIYGDYADWPLEQKQALVRALIDARALAESEDTRALLAAETEEGERHAIADRLVLSLTDFTDAGEITVDTLTYALMGPEHSWSSARRLWWQEIAREYHGDGGAADRYVAAADGDISEAEAIAIARAAIEEAWGLEKTVLDGAVPVANLYVTEQRPDYRRWNVEFRFVREDDPAWVEKSYAAIVDQNGQVVGDEDLNEPSVYDYPRMLEYWLEEEGKKLDNPAIQRYRACYARYGAPFEWWSLEDKAQWTEEVLPLIAEWQREGLVPQAEDYENTASLDMKAVLASTAFRYGLPDEAAMPEEEALALALREARYARGELPGEYAVFYDVTDPQTPLWKFLFRGTGEEMTNYRVQIEAHSGRIVLSEAFERVPVWKASFEEAKKCY